jgi:hypothetical protein
MRRSAALWTAVAAVIVFRCFVWTAWQQSYFDSDQAVVGLMAKHIVEGRAFPVFFYGQHYLLAVEAWLAAPLFAVLGPSVFALKLPLVAVNLAVAVVLVWILVDQVGLTRPLAMAASMFFLLPPPVTASRLMEAGAGVEPFLYALVLWIVRGRPVAFGLVAGVGIMHREFTAFAVVAILLLELRRGQLLAPQNLRDKLFAIAEIVAIALVVGWFQADAPVYGPGTSRLPAGGDRGGHLAFLLSRVCWSAAAIPARLQWLFTHNLSLLFGWRRLPLSMFVNTSVVGGHAWVVVPLAVLPCAAAAAVLSHRSSDVAVTPQGGDRAVLPGRDFPAYLALVGLQTLALYALVTCGMQDEMLVRYTLLALLLAVAAAALAFAPDVPRRIKAVALAAIVAWTAAAGIDNARVLGEYLRRPPPDDYRDLADFLEREGIRYARGPYWTAYRIDFLTNERVIVGSYENLRVAEYETVVDRHDDRSAVIYYADGCRPGEDAVKFRRWCIARFSRARGVR